MLYYMTNIVIIDQIVDSGSKLVSESSDKLIIVTIMLLDFLKNNVTGILTFLFEKNIIQTMVGLIIASQVSKVTNVLSDVIISPTIQVISFGEFSKLEDFKIHLFGVEFKIGLLIITLVNLLIVLIIVYYIWKLSRVENYKFLTDILDNAKTTTQSYQSSQSRPTVLVSVSANPN